MINIALLGAGRIGKMHAEIITAHPESNLQFVYDVNKEFASQVAKQNNAESLNSPEHQQYSCIGFQYFQILSLVTSL